MTYSTVKLALYASLLGVNAGYLIVSAGRGNIPWVLLHALAVTACLTGIFWELGGFRGRP